MSEGEGMSMLETIQALNRKYAVRPPAPHGYVKAGVPVARLPDERQSLPLPTDLTNCSDPLRLVVAKPSVAYEPPPRKQPNWITQLKPAVARAQRKRRGPSERVRQQAARAEQLSIRLEQKRLDNIGLEGTLRSLKNPLPRTRAINQFASSSIWPQLATPTDAFARAVAGRGEYPVPAMHQADGSPDPTRLAPHLSRATNLCLLASTSAYIPAGMPVNHSMPWTYASGGLGGLSWGRPAEFEGQSKPSPTVTYSLGLGQKRLL
jgi:hypothetical protein